MQFIKISHLLPFVIFTNFIFGCDRCVSEVQIWKNTAKTDLEELKKVVLEIKSFESILAKEKFENNELYLRTDSPEQYEKKYNINLSKHKQWFKKRDWGHISYKNDIVEASYQECYYFTVSYTAYFYYSKSGIAFDTDKKLVGKIIENIPLEDNWHLIVIRCDGCGE